MASDGDQTRRERPSQSGELTTPRDAMFGAEPSPSLGEETRTMGGVGDEDAAVSKKFPVDGWDRYEFVSFLGSGGMGAVYTGRHPERPRFVAVSFQRGAEGRPGSRFLAEARAQARVEHEHVCKVYEVG